MSEAMDNAPLLQLDYALTREETHAALLRTTKRAGKLRMGIQTAVLVILAAYCFIGYALSGGTAISPNKDNDALRLGIAALVILAIMWLVPAVYFRFEAQSIHKKALPVSLAVWPDRLSFGGSAPAEYDYKDVRHALYDDMIVLLLGSDVVAIPRRVAGDGEWRLLCDTLTAEREAEPDGEPEEKPEDEPLQEEPDEQASDQ